MSYSSHPNFVLMFFNCDFYKVHKFYLIPCMTCYKNNVIGFGLEVLKHKKLPEILKNLPSFFPNKFSLNQLHHDL